LESRVDVVKQRLQRSIGSGSNFQAADAAPGAPSGDAGVDVVGMLFGAVGRLARPDDEGDLGRLRTQLIHAGFRSNQAMPWYLGAKVLLCFGFAGLFLGIHSILVTPIAFAPLITVVLMIIGFYLPNIWISGRAESRQIAINRAMPDALDLLVTCVEAGLGLDSALNRVAGELSISSELLAQELNQTALEMRAGLSRADAFRRLASRTGVEEIRHLSSIVIQTEVFGTSVAASLRVMSDAMRVRRMQRAEEKGAMVAVKMTIPLVLFVLPSLLLVLVGPAMVRIIRILLPTMGGDGPQPE
jgi:tight adherence protein C